MRRRLPLLRPLLVLGVSFLIAAIVLLAFVRIDRVVIARGHLAGGTEAVYAPWEGRVESVFVEPGDSVRTGMPLIRLESEPLRAEDKRIKARIENLTDRIRTLSLEKERLVSNVHPAEITQAARDLKRARLELSTAQTQFDIKKQLWDQGLTTKIELEEARLALKLAEVTVTEAEQAAPLLESKQQARIEEIDGEMRGIEGQITEERATQDELRRKLALSTVAAEADGIVLGDRLFELEGRTVNRGEEILRLSTGTAERFDGVIYDTGRASARAGLKAKIRLEGYPWLIHGTLSGRVDFVGERRGDGGGFPLEVSFDASTAPGPLYDGMKGQARIVVDEKVSLGRLLIEKILRTKEP